MTIDLSTPYHELTTITSWPLKPTVLVFGIEESLAVNGTFTTAALGNVYLAFTNLTPSNFTVHSTDDPPTSSASSNNASEASMLSSANNASHNNTIQRQSGRAFEVPLWLVCCYCVILLCAVVGNLLVISTLVQNRRMRTITNVFLLNLAISDILLGVLCMPVTLVGTLLRHFIFGEFFCKLIQFSQAASVAVSSWTLVAISCERYYAICHPLRSRRWQTRSHAYKTIACIWCGSMFCMLPIAFFSQLMPTSRQGLRKCREHWPSYAAPYERCYNLFLNFILLIMPLLVLSLAYILITRTLYVGMRIEKSMIFDGKHEDTYSSLQRKSHSTSLVGKSLYLTTSSLSENESSISRHKLNLSLRCHGGSTKNTASYNNLSSVAIPQHQRNFEKHEEETNTFCQQQQQQTHNNLQQRPYQQHNYENYHQQHQSHQQSCCGSFSCLFCKRSNNTSISTSTNNRRPHLYCMRFATLKTSLADKAGNSITNFCTADYCMGSGGGGGGCVSASTATINTNIGSSNMTPAAMALSLSSTASSSTTLIPTMHRNQIHQQHQLQHNNTRCYCMVQQIEPQFNYKTDAKNKRSLKATESVLRRNNIAKNLESKKRVIKMLAVLVLEFFICWTPLYVVNTMAMYIGSAIYEYIDYTSISVLQLLAYSSSCCNPITYCFMNANFRRAFLDTFKGMQWCSSRLQRNRPTVQKGRSLYLAGSIRINSCTVQTVIDSPRL